MMVGGWQVHTLIGHSNAVNSVAFSPNGNRVVSGSDDYLVKIWDVETGAGVRAFLWDCVECGDDMRVYTAVVLLGFCLGSRLKYWWVSDRCAR